MVLINECQTKIKCHSKLQKMLVQEIERYYPMESGTQHLLCEPLNNINYLQEYPLYMCFTVMVKLLKLYTMNNQSNINWHQFAIL